MNVYTNKKIVTCTSKKYLRSVVDKDKSRPFIDGYEKTNFKIKDNTLSPPL